MRCAWPTVLAMFAATAASSGCNKHHRAADEPPPPRDLQRGAVVTLVPVDATTLCVTHGALAGHAQVTVPTFRAVAPGHAGEAAAVTVLVHGTTSETRALASGQQRRQLGLKLRADDGCNLVYVMWRLDPKPKLEVSVKRNPGARTSKQCGAGGYTKVRPTGAIAPPALDDQKPHELRAEIHDDALTAWIDRRVVWEGALPEVAHGLGGPAGVRSDDLAYDLLGFAVDAQPGGNVDAKCVTDEPAEDQE